MFLTLILFGLITGIIITIFAYRSDTVGVFMLLAFTAYAVIYYIPLLLVDFGSVSSGLILSIAVGLFGLVSGLITVFPNLKSRGKGAYMPAASNFGVILVNLLFILAIVAIFQSLRMSGGLFVVIEGSGGAEYLDVRVNSKFSGILGLLIWLAQVPIVLFLYFFITSKKNKLRLGLKYFVSFSVLMAGYILLTVRHNAVATILALFVTYIILTGFTLRKLMISFILSLLVVTAFQAIRVTGIDDLSLDSAYNTTAKSFEHISVTEDIIHKTNINGFTYFKHLLDVPIFFIPRFLWDEKPRTSFLNRRYFPQVASSGSEKAIGIVGEGYSALGLFGVFINSFVFSLFLSKMQSIIDSSENLLIRCLVAAIITPYAYIGVRTGVFGKHLLSIFIMLFECYIIYFSFKLRVYLKPSGEGIVASR